MKKYFETKENSIESAAYKAAETKIEKKELEKLKEPKTYLGFKENSLADVIKNVVVEETEYQKMFKKEIEKAGKSIPQMSDAEKKAFFDKIDSKYKAKNEGATDKEIDKFHKSLDKLVHKSFGHSSDEKKKEMNKETHTIYKDKANQKQKDAEGEETPKKFKDIRKENKRKTDIGTEKTPVDMEPNVNFKN